MHDDVDKECSNAYRDLAEQLHAGLDMLKLIAAHPDAVRAMSLSTMQHLEGQIRRHFPTLTELEQLTVGVALSQAIANTLYAVAMQEER